MGQDFALKLVIYGDPKGCLRAVSGESDPRIVHGPRRGVSGGAVYPDHM